MSTLDHAAVQELLGAYSLDATEGEERLQIEEHLATCPRCLAEVDAYREVAAALGNSAHRAPDHLWERIVGEMRAEWDKPEAQGLPMEVRSRLDPPGHLRFQLSQADSDPSRPGSSDARLATKHGAGARWDVRRRMRALAGVAAAALVVAVGLGVALGLVNGQQRELQASGVRQAAVAALRDPTALTASLTSAGGLPEARVAIVGGRGYLVAKSMAALPTSETYQLWALIDGRPISLGLLGRHPSYEAFSLGTARPSEMMVTVEPAGGVVTPDRFPIAQGQLG